MLLPDVLEFDSLGGAEVSCLTHQDLQCREECETVGEAQRQARYWYGRNWLVGTVLDLKAAFYNYGLKLNPVGESAKKALDPKSLAGKVLRAKVNRYIRDAWNSYLITDSLVSFWKREKKVTPFTLRPEMCSYSDAMGVEELIYSFRLSAAAMRKQNNENRTRYAVGGTFVLSEDNDEYYRVLTRGDRGYGFGWPRMLRVFKALSQCESMEFGESRLAYGGRLVVRNHKMGWEVRNGGQSARTMQADALWDKKRSAKLKQFYQGAQGFKETSSQFDVVTQYEWVDPKWYEAKKWQTIENRMLWYGGPLAFLLFGKAPLNVALLGMLRTEACAEENRPAMKLHLEEVIAQGFGLEVSVSWGVKCFTDERIAWDMVKFLTQQGPLSTGTALERADEDPAMERARKADEAGLPEEQVMPLFDKNHGNDPSKAGRKAGSKAGDKVENVK